MRSRLPDFDVSVRLTSHLHFIRLERLLHRCQAVPISLA
jgi:hypothetical protein